MMWIWQVMVALARYGPRGQGQACRSISKTRTGRATLWVIWALIAAASAHTLLVVLAQRRDLLDAAHAS